MKRQYLKFDGRTSFLKIPGFGLTCVSNPSLCTNGLTYSFLVLVNSSVVSRSGKSYLVDILGQSKNYDAGVSVTLENGRIGVKLTSLHETWQSSVVAPLDSWIHFMFTWNAQFGLSIYIDGAKK